MADDVKGGYGKALAGARPTLGVLVTWLRDKYENQILRGIHDVAEEAGANVICMVWGEMRRDLPTEEIYNLVGQETFSGLVLSTTMGHAISAEVLQELCDHFAYLPIISGPLNVQGITKVLTDSYSGMYAAIEHLVEKHGYRQIAFICGPVGQREAEDRFRAYREVLEAHAIPFDERYIANGDYRAPSGREAMETLLARGLTFEAVAAANDDMAMGAMEVLQQHGYQIPDDVALVGFDDKDEVRHLSAPLTTVRQPIYDFAREMGRLLLQRIAGEPTPDEATIPTQLVLRRSCGCFPRDVEAAWADVVMPLGEVPAELSPPLDIQAQRVWEAFLADWQAGDSQQFLNACDRVLRESATLGQPLISALRAHVLAHLSDPRTWLIAENLLHQGRALAGDIARRAEGYHWVAVEQREGALERFDADMSAAFALEELAPALQTHFPNLGLHRCYIAIYESDWGISEYVRLLVSYVDAQATVFEQGPRFRACDLAPEGVLSVEQRYTLVVLPLSLRDRVLGYALFESDSMDGIIYDRLGEQLSGTLFRILLLQQQEQARREAEIARVQSERALEDLLVLQKQQVRESWQDFTEGGLGYIDSAQIQGPAAQVWLPQMREAVVQNQVIKSAPEEDRSVLAIPMYLYGEIVGVLGVERAEPGVAAEETWPAEDVALVEMLAEQIALALENQRLLEEVQRRALQLRAAAEVGQLMSSVLNLDEALPRVVDLIRERLELYYVGIFLVDESGQWAVLRAGTGEAGREMLTREHRLAVGGTSMIGSCISERRAKIAFDVGAEAVRFSNPLLPDTHSEMALPLLSRGEPVGAMTIQAVETAAFSEADITTLQTMADQLGSAIENARLLRRMEANMQALETARGEYTLEAWRDFMRNVGRSLGYRYDLELQPPAPLHPEAQQALTEAASVQAHLEAPEDDERAARGALAVPIRLWDQTLGVVNLRFANDAIPQETVALVQQITEQLALSLENVRLLEETRARAARERLTGAATARMRETLDIDTVLQTALQEMGELLGLAETEVRLDLGAPVVETPQPGPNGGGKA